MQVCGCVILTEKENIWPTLSSLKGLVEEVIILKKKVGFVAKYIWEGKRGKEWNHQKLDKNNYLSGLKGEWLLFLKPGEELTNKKLNLKQYKSYAGYYLPVLDYKNIDNKAPYLELRLIRKEALLSINKFATSFSLSALKRDFNSSLGVLQIPILHYNRQIKKNTYCNLNPDGSNSQKGIEYLKSGNLNQAIYYLKKAWEKEQEENILDLLFIAFIRKNLTILEVLDYFSPRKKYDIIKLIEFYYNNNYLKTGLELISEIDQKYENIDSDYLNYWQGLFWLKLGYFNKAYLSLKKINPSFKNYARVLDIRWIMELKQDRSYKKKGAKNQIKLLGDKLSWKYITIFEGNGDTNISFSSIDGKYMFFQRCLYYLELFIDFGYKLMQCKAEKIVKEFNVSVVNRELAWLYYHKDCLNKALPYVKKVLQEYYSSDYEFMLDDIYRKL